MIKEEISLYEPEILLSLLNDSKVSKSYQQNIHAKGLSEMIAFAKAVSS
jgi:hypothetical protein